MLGLRTIIVAVAAVYLACAPASAEVTVAVSIKPVHSLVAAVMEGVGSPALIVDGSASPHTYSLKPSQAAELEKTDIVFWTGPVLESFLEKPLATIASEAHIVELMKTDGLTLLAFREGGTFDAHESGEGLEHQDEDRDPHDAKGAFDPHVWLDPRNVMILVERIEAALSDADPANVARYRANAKTLEAKLAALTLEVDQMLEAAREAKFIVFHDAYRYFEERFDVHAAGSVTVSPDIAPGAARVASIRNVIRETRSVCVFSEPQFEPKIIAALVADTGAKSGVLDPLGTGLADGPDLYFQIIRNMASALANCLSGRG